MLSCSNDSPEPPPYDFCVYPDKKECIDGPFSSCKKGGILSYECPYIPQFSSSGGFSSSSGEPGQEPSSSTGSESSGSQNSSNSSSSSNKSSSSNLSSSSQKPQTSLTTIPNSGYYASSFSITIPPETDLGIIRCEKNGSEPTSNSQIASGSEVTIAAKSTTDNGIVLRCAQFKNGVATTTSTMRTYIIGGSPPQLPVFSIAADPITFTSSGIYNSDCKGGTVNNRPCNSSNFWKDTTIQIYIDFFEKEAAYKWSLPASLQIMGGWSRTNPKKSVKIGFKKEFGQENLKYPLFPEYSNLTKFKGFALRNGGNNWDRDYIRDMLATTLTKGLGIDYQKGRYAIVYYNGNYYGIHNLRERSNDHYYDTNYSIPEENLDLIKNLTEASVGSIDDYNQLMNWLDGLGKDGLDDTKLEELKTRIDLDNFTNYFQSEIYFDNRDWPGNNVKIWRIKSPPSKYKWFLYDVDFGFGASKDFAQEQGNCDMMELVTDDGNKSSCHRSDGWPIYPQKKPTLMLRRLLDNTSYRYAFINRFSLLLATYYAPARVINQIDFLQNSIPSEESTRDINKWGYTSMSINNTNIRTFANSRPGTMNTEIKNYFKLGTPVDFTIEGNVRVHGLQVLNGKATFKAYPGIPIELEAIGCSKDCWSDGFSASKRTINVTETMTLKAL